MIEGSEDGLRDDELDLGHDEPEQLTKGQNGVSDEGERIDGAKDRLAVVEEDYGEMQGPNGEASPVKGSGGEEKEATLSPQGQVVGAPGSVDGTASIPDDTPSVHGSLLSSPASSALAFRNSPRATPSPSHRPFDLRFQSRLSSSSPTGLRSASPFLLHFHSRQSSLNSRLSPATIDSEADTPQGPWEVIKWTKLRKIGGQTFSEVGKRNFGRPTCFTVSTSIVFGTSKGITLVFDYQQNLKTIIGPGTKAVESGAVTSLALSADHSTVAVGHASGDIFTWEISRAAKPFLHIPPIPSNLVENRPSDGHISGVSVVHIGFLGTRRTALVSADERGMAFSHLATRGMGAVGRTVKTTRILGRYPLVMGDLGRPRKPSAVLAFSPLPLGNVEQSTDSLGLVAMLTPYLLVIVSTTPVAQTQHKASRPKEVASHSAMTAALAWFPAIKLKGKESQVSNTKLVYCWSNVLTVLEVSTIDPDDSRHKDRPPSLLFKPRSRWKADEAIVAVQWLSRSVMAVLTITQQLLIVEDYSMRVTESIDLILRHIYHVDLFSSQLHSLVEQFDEEDTSMHGVVADAFYMSFRSYKGRLFLLGYNDLSVGSLSNWADRLLALVEAGDFIGAIQLASSYYRGDAETLTVALPEEAELRHPIVREKLLEMISASLRYAFGHNVAASNARLGDQQLEELAKACISACVCMAEWEFLWDEVFNCYEENQGAGVFLDALEAYIVDGTVRSLPPVAVKALVSHFAVTQTAGHLEEIICLLDTTTMDIDQATSLCKQHNLYDAYIYVWNRALGDYVSPLEELLRLIPSQTEPTADDDQLQVIRQHTNAMKMFPYLSFVLTGRVYPTGNEMEESEAGRAKAALYNYIFSGQPAGLEGQPRPDSGSFSVLRTILQFNTSSFMSMLNEAFEDGFLNEQENEDALHHGASVNRQYILSILLQVMTTSSFTPLDTIYLDMFIARNLPKYPQYILLSGSTLHQVLVRLCQYPSEEMVEDCELSAEYLLSIYHPPDTLGLIPLYKEARFFRILKSTYRSEKQYAQLILTYLEDPREQQAVFTALQDCLRPSSGLGKKQRRDVIDVIKRHAGELAMIDVTRSARTMRDLAPETHEAFLAALETDTYRQWQYLTVLIEPSPAAAAETTARAQRKGSNPQMIERYVQLLCRYNPGHVADFVDALQVGDVRIEELLPWIEESGVVDAAVILLARQGQVRGAMDRLIAHLGTLEAGLVGLLQSLDESPDSASADEAMVDLVASLNKYARVGVWLCQGQTKTAKKSPPTAVALNGRRRGVAVLDQPLAFDEGLWLDLIEGVVRIASNVFGHLPSGRAAEATQPTMQQSRSSRTARLTESVRSLVQQVFTALLSSTVRGSGTEAAMSATTWSTERTDVSFLRILRAFLGRAATWSPSLMELRAVLGSIFAAYAYEKTLLALAHGMLDKDLFVHVDEVTARRQQGWRPRGQACELCRRRIWGSGVGPAHWNAWERRQEDERQRRMIGHGDPDHDHDETETTTTTTTTTTTSTMPFSHRDPLRHSTGAGSRRGGGKGKAAVATTAASTTHPDHTSLPLGSGSQEMSSDASVGPVVVFSCRHLFHRACLVGADVVDGYAVEMTCPTCT
ncbi:hypothetical protein ASPZODRAFT_15305 [Penicilliopsis zonata CBS 506.65]|uniref:Uncharacterized protein n=1 Tax=Penicilliopsis zonata CBS 506.65 TaxID=1073090 RepID=A0A1L9SL05_9EURO|nr:hypothetical protein ASPZODRAFT_15305 [Penicilliopsis zonata CBS 506.65]OJJ47858.1 hypothetical protein ASPZODRAFT_15305 [Penicilliopsis zonata CBS 506.65]